MNSLSFTDLEDDLDAIPTCGADTREKFPCMKCDGSGYYQGVRLHQEKEHCFACKGKGYFLTSPQQRAKARVQRIQARQRKQEAEARRRQERAEKWHADHEAEAQFLREVSGWNDFALSMLNAINHYGSLTEGQMGAVQRMMQKHEARKAEKAKAAADKPTIELARINDLLNTALNAGLKKPKLRIGKLAISIAPAHGRNAGCLYVKDRGDYAGKITPEGKFFKLREAREAITDELVAIAADPLHAATVHGQQTGQCSCCGRELTDPESVRIGIGPICREKWGM